MTVSSASWEGGRQHEDFIGQQNFVSESRSHEWIDKEKLMIMQRSTRIGKFEKSVDCILTKENSPSSDTSERVKRCTKSSRRLLLGFMSSQSRRALLESPRNAGDGWFLRYATWKNDEDEQSDFINQGVYASQMNVLKFLYIIVRSTKMTGQINDVMSVYINIH